jgi:type II secretory pathway component PulF
VEGGAPVEEAARAAGMPGVIVSALGLARGGEAVVLAFEFSARHYEFRAMRREAVLRSLYVPAMVFVMGAMVAFIALAMFEPLVKLAYAWSSNARLGF